LVIRLRQGPNDSQLAALNEQFGHLLASGSIERAKPSKIERRDDDLVSHDRIAFTFSNRGYSELITMIKVLNTYVD
jgi:hypothetical protein